MSLVRTLSRALLVLALASATSARAADAPGQDAHDAQDDGSVPPWVVGLAAAAATAVVIALGGAVFVLVNSRPAPDPKSGSLDTIDARTH